VGLSSAEKKGSTVKVYLKEKGGFSFQRKEGDDPQVKGGWLRLRTPLLLSPRKGGRWPLRTEEESPSFQKRLSLASLGEEKGYFFLSRGRG